MLRIHLRCPWMKYPWDDSSVEKGSPCYEVTNISGMSLKPDTRQAASSVLYISSDVSRRVYPAAVARHARIVQNYDELVM